MRDVNNLRGLHLLRTMQSTKRRSIPRIQSSTYLDLYMLDKEKERLSKEGERLILRDTAIKKRLEEIDMEVNKLHKDDVAIKDSKNVCSSGHTFLEKNGFKKEWKKMSLNY